MHAIIQPFLLISEKIDDFPLKRASCECWRSGTVLITNNSIISDSFSVSPYHSLSLFRSLALSLSLSLSLCLCLSPSISLPPSLFFVFQLGLYRESLSVNKIQSFPVLLVSLLKPCFSVSMWLVCSKLTLWLIMAYGSKCMVPSLLRHFDAILRNQYLLSIITSGSICRCC